MTKEKEKCTPSDDLSTRSEIVVPEWVRVGGMLYRRSALPPEHGESLYSYCREHYPDVDPRDFGIECPRPRP